MERYLILLPILLPLLGGIGVFFLKDRRLRRIAVTVLTGATFFCALGVCFLPNTGLILWDLGGSLSIRLCVDEMSVFFLMLVSVLWVLAAIFAFEYMQHEQNEERFFGFFTMTLGVLMGIGLAENLLTLYLFYEMMTLITLPLVIHGKSKEANVACKAGRSYTCNQI